MTSSCKAIHGLIGAESTRAQRLLTRPRPTSRFLFPSLPLFPPSPIDFGGARGGRALGLSIAARGRGLFINGRDFGFRRAAAAVVEAFWPDSRCRAAPPECFAFDLISALLRYRSGECVRADSWSVGLFEEVEREGV